jgi:hypothetical protein
VAKTSHQVQNLVDQYASLSPDLVGSYKGYNLVNYNHLTYGIPISLGHIDLRKEEDRTRPGIIPAETLQQLKNLIDNTVIKYSATRVHGATSNKFRNGRVRIRAHHVLRRLKKIITKLLK